MTEPVAPPRVAPRYPAEAVEIRALADGQPLLIRPLASRDGPLLQDFVRRLSVHSRHQRFQSGLVELAPGLLARLLDIDYARNMAFAAVVYEDGERRMVGEARYAPALDGGPAAEFALAVADAWQKRGLGGLLLGKLLGHAASSGIARMQGDVLHDNAAMIGLARRFGFALKHHPDGAWLTRVERTLGAPHPGDAQAGTSSFQSSLPPAYTATLP